MYEAMIKGFQELFSRGERPNFIFVGGSIYHLASLVSFIEKKQADGIGMSGVIFDWVTPPHRRQIQEDLITCLSEESFVKLESGKDVVLSVDTKTFVRESVQQFVRLANGKPLFEGVYSDEAPLYLFYPLAYEPDAQMWNTVFAISDHVCLVQYDEGLGSYVIPLVLEENANSEHGSSVGERLYEKAYSTVNRIVKRMQKRRALQTQEYTLFALEGDECVLNQERAVSFEKAFRRFALTQGVESRDLEGKAIIVGFDLAKLADTLPSELEMYRKIRTVLDAFDLEPVFRPHPSQREEHVKRYEQLGMAELDQPEASLESILAASSNRPAVIIGLGSTSQATANAFWHIPCISITQLLRHELEEAHVTSEKLDYALQQQDVVSRLFKNNMVTPRTYDELIEELKRLNIEQPTR